MLLHASFTTPETVVVVVKIEVAVLAMVAISHVVTISATNEHPGFRSILREIVRIFPNNGEQHLTDSKIKLQCLEQII